MRATACLLLLQITVTQAAAIPPAFMPDEEMAQSPIIVVGKWQGTPLKARELVEGNLRKKLEGHTELTVERVIKGDIKPGKHKLLLGAFIAWGEKGGPVMSFTSTEAVGDVEDVTKSNLWFLTQRRSWDAADKHVYLGLENYRAVQPLQLEEYYRVLGEKDYRSNVPKLLLSVEPLVLRRTLEFLTGGVLPWPYEPGDFGEYMGLKARWQPMVEHATAVEKLLARKEPDIRREAAAVYAGLAGKSAIPRLRQLLQDTDPEVRGIASGVLISHKDADSYQEISRAVRSIEEPVLACKILARISASNHMDLAPTAIEFLQNDGYAGRLGDDFKIPAFKAQAALKALTGYDFPFDVAASRKAWENAKGLEPQRRKDYLAKVLPYDPRPLAAELVKDGDQSLAVITNRSDKALWLAKTPDEVSVTRTNGAGSFGSTEDITGKESFVELAPGKSLRIPIKEDHLERPRLTRVVLRFLHNGNAHEVNAWIGSVEVSFKRTNN